MSDDDRDQNRTQDRRSLQDRFLRGVSDQLKENTTAVQELKVEVAEMRVSVSSLVAGKPDFEDRLRKLESSSSRFQGAIAILSALWALMIALIIWKLGK